MQKNSKVGKSKLEHTVTNTVPFVLGSSNLTNNHFTQFLLCFYLDVKHKMKMSNSLRQ